MSIAAWQDPLEAYREDCANVQRAADDVARDDVWLRCAIALQHAGLLSGDERREYLGEALEGLRTGASPVIVRPERSHGSLVLLIADNAEEAEMYALATVILELARAVFPLQDTRLQGRLLAQQARIMRKLSELDRATELYDAVGELGAATGDDELVCRAEIGKAVVARVKGNYPEARSCFERVLLKPATSPELGELHALAHEGLMIAAATASDFETALHHGRAAYDFAAPHSSARQTIVLNLARLCADCGQHRAALNAYLRALAQPLAPRIRRPTLGNAVLAAAHCGERRLADELAGIAAGLIDDRNDQYEVADLERSLSEAYFILGDRGLGERFKAAALRRARLGRFFELEHEAEVLGPVERVEPAVALSDDALDVVKQFEQDATDDLMAGVIARSG